MLLKTISPGCGVRASLMLFLYTIGDPDHSQNLVESKLDQDPLSFFQEDTTSSICVILLTYERTEKQTNVHENNTSTKPPSWRQL